MGLARCLRCLQRCNTKAKLAIKQNYKQEIDKWRFNYEETFVCYTYNVNLCMFAFEL